MTLVRRLFCLQCVVLLVSFVASMIPAAASDTLFGGHHASAPTRKGPAPDYIVFDNGDRLTGTFVREVGGTVMFDSEILGNIEVPWKKIKELHTKTKLAVLNKSVTARHGLVPASIPQGTISVANNMITVQPADNTAIPLIPVKHAQYIVDEMTLKNDVPVAGGLDDFALQPPVVEEADRHRSNQR